MRVFLNPQSSFSEEKFAEKVMKTIGLPYTQSGTNVMALALQGLCESQEELPIFVTFDSDDADEKLIRPIASSRKELRSRYFHVDDLTDEQCLEYVESRLSSMIKGDEQEISNFMKEVVPHLGIGNRSFSAFLPYPCTEVNILIRTHLNETVVGS